MRRCTWARRTPWRRRPCAAPSPTHGSCWHERGKARGAKGAPMRTWRLPADVDTDQLAPGHAMKHGIDIIASHCLESVRPEFAQQAKLGDVIVAGANFGIGSSRE